MKNLFKILLHKYAFVFLLFGLIASIWAVSQSSDHQLHIKVYDVGEGESIFIKTPSDKRILIDGGPDSRAVERLGRDVPFYDKALDLVVLTNPKKDRLSGLISMVKKYEVRQVWMQRIEHTSDLYTTWLEILKSKKSRVGVPKAGDQVDFGDGVVLKVLWPKMDLKSTDDLGSTSIVILIEHNKFKALLTSAAGEDIQPYLWPQGEVAKIDVLKVPDYASKSALSEPFLKQLSPKTAIISVGKNNSGYPAEETITRLIGVGSRIYRTDKDGSIEVVSDGERWYTRSDKR